jgi:hypothetical protein
MPTIHTMKGRGPITAVRLSPPNERDEDSRTIIVSYIVMMYEVGGTERPIASHDNLASCEDHIVRLARDACSRSQGDKLYYSWVPVERYP